MAVTTEVSKSTYTGNGITTAFSTGFRFLANAEIVVKVTPSGGTESVKTLGVDYNVTGAGVDPGGTVTFVAAPASGAAIAIERTVPITQVVSFRTQGDFSPSVHEDAMDEKTFVDQQLDRRLKALESAGAPGSVVAGNGLFFSSTTLHVGAGVGVQVNADTVDVLYSAAGPLSVQAGAAANAGATNAAARSDHRHSAATAATVSGAVVIGANATEGTATTLARSDHTHEVKTAAPVTLDKSANAAGVATTFARSDHKHDINTAVVLTLTDATNAEGTATTLARSDHTHSHGTRAGGNLHAQVTTTTDGFMIAADKAKLDGLATETLSQNAITTTDATPTKILTITPTDQTAECIELYVVAKRQGASGGAAYLYHAGIMRTDGVTTQIAAPTAIGTAETTGTMDVTFTVASPDWQIFVTGVAAQTYHWAITARRKVVS